MFFLDLSLREENLEKVYETAKHYKEKLNWVLVDWSKYSKHAERLGLSGQVQPSLAIENMVDGRHYAFDEKAALTKESIRAWIDSFLRDELAPTIKSEEIPENNNGPVKILVANNFDQIVNDPTKDVFVEFYAPWCGHCKKLAPLYEELGINLKDKPNIVISKIDATANDVPMKYNIRGFPTLKFFPAKDKTPIDYEGDRTLEDMQKFVERHSTNFKDEL